MYLGLAGTAVYICAWVALLGAIFWKPRVGLYFLIPLLPLQTVRYRLHALPGGAQLIDAMILAVILGLKLRGQPVFPKTPLRRVLAVFAMFTWFSLCLGTVLLSSSPSLLDGLADWKNYMVMPLLYFLVVSAFESRPQMYLLLGLMCLGLLGLNWNFRSGISGRDFSNYSHDLRYGGAMGYASANGLAAFEAQCFAFLLAVWAAARQFWLRFGALAVALTTAACLAFSFSRGAYIAFLVSWLFIGLVKKRVLLLLLAVFLLAWEGLVPSAVRQRVFMTYQEDGTLEASSATRVSLWTDALDLFAQNPLSGTGFNTYAQLGRSEYRDTHNYYLKVLVETGLAGLAIFVWLLRRIFGLAFGLFRKAGDPLMAVLGLGMTAWMVSTLVCNCFGDRWTYIEISGYTWVLLGLMTRLLQFAESEPCSPECGDALPCGRASVAAFGPRPKRDREGARPPMLWHNLGT